MIKPRNVLALVSLACCLRSPPTWAQSVDGSDTQSPPSLGTAGRMRHRNAAAASSSQQSSIPAVREIWPRLDFGAVLCQSREDLIARAHAILDPTTGQRLLPTGCRPILAAVPVTVVDRVPPGSTEVRLASGETGWTDAWLPEKEPEGRSTPYPAPHGVPSTGG